MPMGAQLHNPQHKHIPSRKCSESLDPKRQRQKVGKEGKVRGTPVCRMPGEWWTQPGAVGRWLGKAGGGLLTSGGAVPARE